MGTIPPQKLLSQWKQETLTVERAIGQMLQHQVLQDNLEQEVGSERRAMQSALHELQASVRSLRTDVDRLIAHTNLPPPSPKRGRPRKT
ncbi:hypothetical protein QUF63_16410 [Anaerolineales bacterium HSG25]|nr:hypothetical protein [Anaerolineales bacterium HSG25]